MKKYKGINYRFRPDSYWVDKGIRQSILRDIKGKERRRIIDKALRSGRFDQVQDVLVDAEIPNDLRQKLGAIHPCFMGGEYLPGYLESETEIARIDLESTTSDVISIRARVEEGLIYYRVVDEYKGEFRLGCESSEEPFSLQEFVDFIDGTDLIGLSGPISLAYNEFNMEGVVFRSELRYFTTISSDIYPQLNEHYEHVFDEWVEGEEVD
ncbi:hypothetical protein N8592_01095 [Verrucomicrobia bacterium]|nr:hypothetical protein [Verrucomicrobiota bacterium]